MSRLHEIEPRRWADDPDAGVLRELLQGARGDLPEPPALDALAAKLGIDVAPPGATGSAGAATTSKTTASRPGRSPARPEATSDAPWWTAGGPLRPAVGLLAAAAAVGLIVAIADRRAEPTTARSSSPALRPAPADELLPLDTPGAADGAPDAPEPAASPAAEDVVSRPAGAPAVGRGAGRTEGNAPAQDDRAAAAATPAPELARSLRPGDPAPRRAAPSSPSSRPTADNAPPPAGERRADPSPASSPAPAAPAAAADGLAVGPGSDPAADDGAAGEPSSAPQDLRPSSPAAPSELALIRTMRDALRGGSPFVALQAVATHAEVYPDGSLTEERRSYQIRALAAAGRREDARRLAAAFRRDYPSSVHADAIDDALRR